MKKQQLINLITVLFILSTSKMVLASENDELLNLSLEDLINIKVVSASQSAETLNETPVPVTVVTSEMIRNIGAKNLKDILVTYIPGMTFSQDHNEINVAMRGIYASSQQKILILQDGHRLNSRTYSEANPDYSISLEKIKQIEIIRGPGSSLYGNVALTAVINLITKSGSDLNGGTITSAVGNYGQKKVSFNYGKEFDKDHELSFWGNYYEADGQPIKISKEEDYSDKPQGGIALIEAIKNRPAHDIGLNYKFGDFSLFAMSKYNNYVSPFSAGGDTGEAYDYSKYRTFMGTGAGLSSQSSYLGLKFDKKLTDDLSLMINAYNDYNNINGLLITDPSTTASGSILWNDTDFGFISQLNQNYNFGTFLKGSALLGVQVDSMSLYDSSFPAGENGEFTKFNDSTKKRLLETGNETIYSTFGQIKHRLGDNFIVNMGLRYDEKKRHEGDNVRSISPRLSTVWIPNNYFDIKASYSQSFVDAPYWYRYNSLASYSGSRDLKPEYLKSLQLSPSFKLFDNRLISNSNIFYNQLNDFIYRDPKAKANDPKYRNAGSLDLVGFEQELAFIEKNYQLHSNLTYQYVLSGKDYPLTGNAINNVPSLTGNLIFDVNPLYLWYDNFSFNLTARYIGEQNAPIVNVNKNGKPYSAPDNKITPTLLFNTGFRITEPWLKKFALDGRIYNLLDTNYQQGGSTPFPYPQASRWYMLNLSYSFGA